MNILLLSTGGQIGGEETFTKNLAVALLNRSNKVWVASGGDIQTKGLMKANIPVAEICITGRNPVGIIKGVVEVRSFIRENKIDIVHCQAVGPAIMGSLICFFNLRQGEKWIYHDHGINTLTYRWLPFLLNYLDLTVTCSDFELVRLKSNGVNDSKIIRIHSGINQMEYAYVKDKTETGNNVRRELMISEAAYVIGYIGRLSPEKGCDLIIPAFSRILEENEKARLLIVGDGIMRSVLQEKVNSLKLSEKVIFTGFRSDISKLLCSMNLLIQPSLRETFSITILEAMAMGIPIIASDAGGNPEQIIPHYNGYLFETGNYLDLSNYILKMMKNLNSADFGKNGKQIIDKYLNIKRMVDQIEFYYKENKKVCE